jgi:predicted dehydrogenase
LVGAGFIGEVHAKAWRALGVPLKICEEDPGRSARLAGQLGAGQASWEELLDDPEVATIDLCLPTDLHRRFAEQALARGKHVFCEKPVALRTEDAAAMEQAARSAGKLLGIGHVLHFWPAYRFAHQLASSGRYGAPLSLSARRLGTAVTWSAGNWMQDPARSGGALFDLHIHDLDFALWIFGAPTEVGAAGRRSSSGAWDAVNSLLRFGERGCANLEGSLLLPPSFPFTMDFRLDLEGASLLYRFQAGANLGGASTEELVLYPKEGAAEPQVIPEGDPYLLELQSFLAAQSGPGEVVTAAEAGLALQVAQELRAALERGGGAMG